MAKPRYVFKFKKFFRKFKFRSVGKQRKAMKNKLYIYTRNQRKVIRKKLLKKKVKRLVFILKTKKIKKKSQKAQYLIRVKRRNKIWKKKKKKNFRRFCKVHSYLA